MARSKTKTKVQVDQQERSRHMYEDMPVWKSILKMVAPSVVLMLVMGSYLFFDSVLSINLASDSYTANFLKPADQVRLFMSGYTPINSIMVAMTLLFGMGVSTRVAINLGAKRKERALNTIKTGAMYGMMMSFIMVPVLIFAAKPWISSQYDDSISGLVADNAFKYAWPVIISLPLMMFNNIISSLLRVEARNKQLLIALITPVFINLFLDWLFMGPGGMGVEGGAWATFISTATTTALMIFFILRNKKSVILFHNLFGWKFKSMSLIGILLVGLSPFLRNISQSVTSTVQMSIVKDVSSHIYHTTIFNNFYVTDAANNHVQLIEALKGIKMMGTKGTEHWPDAATGDYHALATQVFNDFKNFHTGASATLSPYGAIFVKVVNANSANYMSTIITGAMPVFALFFPVMFAFAQAARPIASYNFGAKKYNRVKQTYWYTLLFATIAAIIIYFVVAWGISGPLMDLLQVTGPAHAKAESVLKIMMIAMIMFPGAIAAMVVFGSTDKILLSILSASLQGFILFFPVMYGMKALAIAHPGSEFLFWWGWPIINLFTSIILISIAGYTLHHLSDKKGITLDERVNKIDAFISSRITFRKAKRKAKKELLKNKREAKKVLVAESRLLSKEEGLNKKEEFKQEWKENISKNKTDWKEKKIDLKKEGQNPKKPLSSKKISANKS